MITLSVTSFALLTALCISCARKFALSSSILRTSLSVSASTPSPRLLTHATIKAASVKTAASAAIGYRGREIAEELSRLFEMCLKDECANERDALLEKALKKRKKFAKPQQR